MAEANLEEIFERSLRNIPQGRAYIPVHSLVGRVIEILSIINTIVSKLDCITRSSGGCYEGLCKTGCANIYYKKEDGNITIWKIRSNSFSLERSPRMLKVSSKDFSMNIEGRKIKVKVPSKEGFELVESDLTDLRGLQKVHNEISYVLNKLEPLIRNASENLLRCIRERRLSC